MLCRLLLMRHAKSSWPEGLSDHERPLDAKGISDTPQIASKIKSLGYEPEFVLCSDSLRTRETWSLMVDTLGEHIQVQVSPALYNSTLQSYLDAVAKLNFSGHTLLLVGHNPVIEEIVFALSSETREMKPANVAVLEIHSSDWKDAVDQRRVWKLVKVISC